MQDGAKRCRVVHDSGAYPCDIARVGTEAGTRRRTSPGEEPASDHAQQRPSLGALPEALAERRRA